ncbi:16S rRNA (uracil(1498)-N(3))-methyltransferase [Bacillus smithii]|uniref:16S rRNA (uracil(1498)-N(3))-methyltransferase n=1 Tax=Bacillus smithii TaxID=1479 RepID=UPI003D1FE973
MQRYFIHEPIKDDQSFRIKGEDFHHLSRVMRMKAGDHFYAVFSDRQNQTALAVLDEIFSDCARATVVKWIRDEKELPIQVTVASGLPKGDKLELIIQKGTELGASSFLPFMAERSIVKWDEKKMHKKVVRWEKIAKEAAEQSQRTVIPEIYEPVSIEKLCEMADRYTWKLFAYEEAAKEGEHRQFYETLKNVKQKDTLLIAFGPEGGFSQEEASLLSEKGFIPCGLGPRILRTETAPLYALSAISYHFELMR